MIAKKKFLKDSILNKDWRAIMYCYICGSEYSADSGDYYNIDDEYVFRCCEIPCELVEKNTIFKRL